MTLKVSFEKVFKGLLEALGVGLAFRTQSATSCSDSESTFSHGPVRCVGVCMDLCPAPRMSGVQHSNPRVEVCCPEDLQKISRRRPLSHKCSPFAADQRFPRRLSRWRQEPRTEPNPPKIGHDMRDLDWQEIPRVVEIPVLG